VRCLLVVPESFAHNYIALPIEGRKVIISTVHPFHLGIKAPAVVSVLYHELISLMCSLSDGATFSGNRLAVYLGRRCFLPSLPAHVLAQWIASLTQDKSRTEWMSIATSVRCCTGTSTSQPFINRNPTCSPGSQSDTEACAHNCSQYLTTHSEHSNGAC